MGRRTVVSLSVMVPTASPPLGWMLALAAPESVTANDSSDSDAASSQVVTVNDLVVTLGANITAVDLVW